MRENRDPTEWPGGSVSDNRRWLPSMRRLKRKDDSGRWHGGFRSCSQFDPRPNRLVGQANNWDVTHSDPPSGRYT